MGKITTLTIKPHQCRYPVAGTGEYMKLCGARALADLPYCKAHYEVCHAPPPPRKTRLRMPHWLR